MLLLLGESAIVAGSPMVSDPSESCGRGSGRGDDEWFSESWVTV